MAGTEPITPEPLRSSIRLPRSSCIGLAAGVLIVAAVGLRFGPPIYRQQVAIRAIERMGGEIETRRSGPAWLRDLVGDEWLKWFDDVVRVQLDGTKATDGDLARLKGLTRLEQLSLNMTYVTDAGLVHLKGMLKLEWLELEDTPVTDSGIAKLHKALPGLTVKWSPYSK